MSSSDLREYFDVGVIIPLSEEFEAILPLFEDLEDRSTDTEIRFSVSSPRSDIKIILAQQSDMGRTATIATAISLAENYDFGILVCLGIAASLSSDLRVGDVCYTGELIDALDNTKFRAGTSGEVDMALSSNRYETPRSISVAIQLSRLDPQTNSQYQKWQADRLESGKELLPNPYPGYDDSLETILQPNAQKVIIACGSVSSSAGYNAKLKGLDRRVAALETESGGLFAFAAKSGTPVLTIRGISDYADGNKASFEKATNGNARVLAAQSAATFLKLQVQSDRFMAILQRRKDQVDETQQRLALSAPTPFDPISAALEEAATDIEARLRELSPGYSLRDRGYRLPVPRIRPIVPTVEVEQSSRLGEPVEVRDALRANKVLLLSLPREYPDDTTAWVIARDILDTTMQNAQPVPVVIDPAKLQRPRKGIVSQFSESILAIKDSEIAKLVVIIDGFSFSSKTKTGFLLQEIVSLPNAQFIVVTKEGTNLIAESDFAARTSCSINRVCDVSFSEMTHFIQKKHDLSRTQAEVIARRLKDTLNGFDLSLHPSYVAGIPMDVLTSLLDANRRAELLQLAVAGYLSFVVSGDTTEVRLSRTTREVFLTRLVYAIRIEKKVFSQAALIEFTGNISKDFDYGIKPIEFINGFIEHGVLHFEDERVRFTLPFMEAYLLAQSLLGQPAKAKQYFNASMAEIDFNTFSIYAELGPSRDVVDSIAEALQASVNELEAAKQKVNILWANTIIPRILTDDKAIKSIRKSISDATADVISNKDKTSEKQKMLDAIDDIREAAASSKLDKQKTAAAKKRENRSERALAAFMLSAILLGAGAERLLAEDKRIFAARTIRLVCLVADEWTRENAAIDFVEIKRRVLASQNIKEAVKKGIGAESDEALQEVLSALVDFIEYAKLSEPFAWLTHTLCENAHEKVLAQSVKNIGPQKGFDAVIQGLWMADIDPGQGKPILLKAIKKMPIAFFLRMSMSSHLATRAFWSHSRREDQLTLFELANEAVQRVGRKNDPKRIEAVIDSSKVDNE